MLYLIEAAIEHQEEINPPPTAVEEIAKFKQILQEYGGDNATMVGRMKAWSETHAFFADRPKSRFS